MAFHCRSEYDLFQIELSKNYGVTEWRDDLKKVMLKAGLENTPVVFLFSDTQVSNSFLGKDHLQKDLHSVFIGNFTKNEGAMTAGA